MYALREIQKGYIRQRGNSVPILMIAVTGQAVKQGFPATPHPT